MSDRKGKAGGKGTIRPHDAYVANLQKLITRARTDFKSFVLLMKPPDASGYYFGKLHRYLAGLVQRIIDEKPADIKQRGYSLKRSSVSVPPQHGKSRLLTVLAAAWLLGRKKGISIAITGAINDLLRDFSKEIRALVNSPRYQWVFKGVVPVFGSNRSDTWTLTNGSSIIARPAGSKLTGRRVDFLIIDDPHRGRREAESEVERHRVQEWYFADCYSRLAPNAKVLVVACLTGDTLISMWDGTRKRIADIKVGDNLAQFQKGTRVRARVEARRSQGKDRVYELRTGNHLVKANAKHPWLVMNKNGHLEWVETQNLWKGDRLVCSGLERHARSSKRITSDEAWALGFMFGDGWVTVNKKRNKKPSGAISHTRSFVTCFAAGEYPEIDERMLCFLESRFGRRPRLTKFGYYRFEVADAGRWFIENGIVGGAKGKRLPEWVFGLSVQLRRSLLSGFVDADGCVTGERERYSVVSCNRGLIDDFRSLVRSCGMNPTNVFSRSSIAQAPNSPAPILSHSHSFAWQQSEDNSDEFKLATLRKKTLLKKKEEVFDIQVSGEASFIADGLVSHNTRWHPQDLIGFLTGEEHEQELRNMGEEDEIFHKIVIEARCEHPEHDPLKRELGEPLCPELGRGEKFLKATEASIPFYEWQSQYQGNPTPRQGDICDVNKLKYCKWADVPDTVVWTRGWDLALTEKEASDFTAGALVGIDEGEPDKKLRTMYIGGMAREKKAWPKLKPIIADTARADLEAHKVGRMGVEVVGGFYIGRDELRETLKGEVMVSGVISSKSKVVRAQPWLNKLEIGRVVIVSDDVAKESAFNSNGWIKRLKDEMISFPSGEHDDQIDAISVAYHLLHRQQLLMA